MELTKQNLLQCIEDQGRIYMEFMGEYYGERYVEIDNPIDNQRLTIPFDFSIQHVVYFTINLDAGASSYWSEIASMQTLDNLLMQGKISTVEYLKRLPAGQISDRETLIDIMQKQEMAAMQQMMGGGNPAPPPADELEVRGGQGYGALQRKINETGEIPESVKEA